MKQTGMHASSLDCKSVVDSVAWYSGVELESKGSRLALLNDGLNSRRGDGNGVACPVVL